MNGAGRSAVLVEFGAPLSVETFPIISPPPGGLLLEMELSTICGTDVHLWQGHSGQVTPPLIPGHEGVGKVVEFGEGLHLDSRGTQLEIGDRIIWGHAQCKSCYACTSLNDETLCERRFVGMLARPQDPPHVYGTFAQYVHVHPRAGRLRVPDAVGSELASAASCALRSVMAALDRAGPIDSRHTVVIQGAGALGLLAAAVISTRSPRALIVIGDPPYRLQSSLALGADGIISMTAHPDVSERVAIVRDQTGGRGADVVFEFSGSTLAMGEGVLLCASKARYIMAGALSGPADLVSAPTVIRKNLTIVGSLGARIGHYAEALDFLEQSGRKFPLGRVLESGRYGLHDVGLALNRMVSAEEVKPVIDPRM